MDFDVTWETTGFLQEVLPTILDLDADRPLWDRSQEEHQSSREYDLKSVAQRPIFRYRSSGELGGSMLCREHRDQQKEGRGT
ncbi:MAG TPA: hypothetical protein VMM12_03125, partial [Longimicrobiales bacterium]|nr:hypothetical protein [Longimicrobiales bacterium]